MDKYLTEKSEDSSSSFSDSNDKPQNTSSGCQSGRRKFRVDWLNTFDWLQKRNGSAFCVACSKQLTSHFSHLKGHEKTNLHIQSYERQKTQMKIKTFFNDDEQESQMRQKYRVQWESDPVFSKWLTQGEDEDRAACACCGCELNARHSDLLRHSQTSKHLRALERYTAEIPVVKKGLSKKKLKKSHGTIHPENSSIEDKDPIGWINNVDVRSRSESIGGSSSTKLDVKLLSTLREIDNSNCLFLFDRCKEYNVSAHQLPYLEKDHVRDLIPKTQLGILAEFEYLLKEWKIRKGFARPERQSSKEENKGKPIMHSRSIQTDTDDIFND